MKVLISLVISALFLTTFVKVKDYGANGWWTDYTTEMTTRGTTARPVELMVPQNTAAVLDDTATIKCTRRSQNIAWSFKPMTSGASGIIAVNCVPIPQYSDIFRIDRNYGACHLIIDNVTMDVAGTYTCQDLSYTEKPLSAELTVLETEPSCRMNTSTVAVAANIPVLFSCQVSFSGMIPPAMKWKDELGRDVPLSLLTINSTFLETGIIMNAGIPIMRPFTSLTYFEVPPTVPPSPTEPAVNAPNYTASWTSPPVETLYVKDCSELLTLHPEVGNGVYYLKLTSNLELTEAYCDMNTTGGGWTVIQRRMDGSADFFRDWIDYYKGFGDATGELWFGNEKIAILTADKRYELRVDLGDWSGESRFALYDNFVVSGASEKYRLSALGTYSGDAGDALDFHLGMQFSTKDQDNDVHGDINCATDCLGAWWYRDCQQANLNGEYNNTETLQGVTWYQWLGHNYPLRFTEMKIRPFTPPLKH